MVQLVPLQESDTHTLADKFLSTVVSQHRILDNITSNCDLCFPGHFWDELMPLLDMILIFSMASYPQTDGIAEATNYIIE